MNNLVKYSEGFLDGIYLGMPEFLLSVGAKTKEILEAFIDSNARTNPEALHHVYEWYQVGTPGARLFDIECQINGLGLSFNATFSQSQSIANGSREPFYDKARIMEEGIGVTIIPKNSEVLVFEDGGQTIFTRNPVRVDNPGGAATKDSFRNIFENFFSVYFRQSFLEISGLRSKIGNVSEFANNLQSGIMSGKPAGISAGKDWISSVGTRL